MRDSWLFLMYCCLRRGPRAGIRIWRNGQKREARRAERRANTAALKILVTQYAQVLRLLAVSDEGAGEEDFLAFPS